jgi:hypothetical protein
MSQDRETTLSKPCLGDKICENYKTLKRPNLCSSESLSSESVRLSLLENVVLEYTHHLTWAVIATWPHLHVSSRNYDCCILDSKM